MLMCEFQYSLLSLTHQSICLKAYSTITNNTHTQCYAPYTNCTSGVAIITTTGRVYGGGYIESAAFNPSLTPFHAAWAAAVTDHVTASQVRVNTFVEVHS